MGLLAHIDQWSVTHVTSQPQIEFWEYLNICDAPTLSIDFCNIWLGGRKYRNSNFEESFLLTFSVSADLSQNLTFLIKFPNINWCFSKFSQNWMVLISLIFSGIFRIWYYYINSSNSFVAHMLDSSIWNNMKRILALILVWKLQNLFNDFRFIFQYCCATLCYPI